MTKHGPAGRSPLTVSVVICTANRHIPLQRTVEALRHQTYRPMEVVIVIGPCTDGTADYVATLTDVKVRCVERLVISCSRNEGIRAATGDLIAFIDDAAIP